MNLELVLQEKEKFVILDKFNVIRYGARSEEEETEKE